MLDEQVEYLNAAKNKNLFFYSNVETNKDVKFFTLKKHPSQEWVVRANQYWKYVLYQPDKLPVQGWKIHLSSNLNQAQEMLDVATPFLVKRKISFKFVPDMMQLLYRNSKNADRSESGKFITIYPHDDSEFSDLLVKLKKMTSQFDLGPYILSDQNWQESNVYFRYGGFKAVYLINDKGEEVPAIFKPDGKKIEDKRVPYYQKPNFVADLPIFTKNTFPNPETFATLKEYKIQEALHFSNAGGVYVAIKGNNKYVLKEGRKGAGLDAKGMDGLTRVSKEANSLKKLSSISGIVKYYDEFTSWRHHFLVEEYIKGETLEDYLPKEFPFLINERQKRKAYLKKTKDILLQLKEIIVQTHKKGLAFGDLSLSNILLTNNGEVRLIDLESVEASDQKYTPGLTTAGFVSSESKTFEDADNFALMRIAYYLFLPIIPIADLSPKIIFKHKRWIEEYFGKNLLSFLSQFDVKQQDAKPIFIPKFLDVPKKELSRKTINDFANGLEKGIINHLNYDGLKLVPGIISDDMIDYLNLEQGAAGVIWALSQNNNELDLKIKKWVSKYSSNILQAAKNSSKLGLFNGISGIASVFSKIGEDEIANTLFAFINQKVDLAMDDISINSGLSGIALVLKDSKYNKTAEKICDLLIDRWNNLKNKDLNDADVGLLTGWSGVSYLAWQFGKKKKAEEILIKILNVNVKAENNFLVRDSSRGFNRLIPYLENGIFGLILLIHKYSIADNKFAQKYKTLFDKLIVSCFNYCTYMPTLISGYAGVLPLANVLAIDGDFKLLDYTLSALNQYLLEKDSEILLPGKYGYKLGLGFSYGSAGLLVALDKNRMNDEFYWLPV